MFLSEPGAAAAEAVSEIQEDVCIVMKHIQRVKVHAEASLMTWLLKVILVRFYHMRTFRTSSLGEIEIYAMGELYGANSG